MANMTLEEIKKSMIPPTDYLSTIGISPQDLKGNYEYAVDQAKMQTATADLMQREATQRAMDLQKYELEKALKQQMQDALVYGNGTIQTSGGSGALGAAGGNGYFGGGGAGGTSLSQADLSRYINDAYSAIAGGGKARSGKEQCPVLVRLLRELFINPAFSLRYRNLAVLS